MASSSGTKHSDQDDLRNLFHHQRQELESAAFIENDLDLAYNLQLQEALTASIDSYPSSSTTDRFTYSPSEGMCIEASGEQEDGVRVLMRFMDEDVERLEMEMSDREMSELEDRRMRDELNRRIHDQKVAAAILAIPDEEWANTGDYFEEPYGDEELVVEENFRVYVKGIVSDERVKDKILIVAGIGVTICDPRDYCLLEMRKAVVDENGNGKDVLSIERVGFEALVEGLKAADGLGLKRISCFCDEFMIHQYVSFSLFSWNWLLCSL